MQVICVTLPKGVNNVLVGGRFVTTIDNICMLLLSAVSSQPLSAMKQSGFLKALGEENIAKDIYEALERAKFIVDTSDDISFIKHSTIKND